MSDRDELTEPEHALIARIGSIYTRFCDIVGNGPTRDADLTEIVHLVHALQDKVMSQAAARAYPEYYRLLGETSFGQDRA